MQKQIEIKVSNQTLVDIDIVLFDALKNATEIINFRNTLPALPFFSYEGSEAVRQNILGTPICTFLQNGSMIFTVISPVTFPVIIEQVLGNYRKLLHFLKTEKIHIKKCRVNSNLNAGDNNQFELVKSLEYSNAEKSLFLPNLNTVKPEQVQTNIVEFPANFTVDKYTSLKVNIRANETKSFIFYYS